MSRINQTNILFENYEDFCLKILRDQLDPDPDSCDLDLVCSDGKLVSTHRVLLSRASPFLHAMLHATLQEAEADRRQVMLLCDFGDACVGHLSALLLTGVAEGLSGEEREELAELCRLLGLEVRAEGVEEKMEEMHRPSPDGNLDCDIGDVDDDSEGDVSEEDVGYKAEEGPDSGDESEDDNADEIHDTNDDYKDHAPQLGGKDTGVREDLDDSNLSGSRDALPSSVKSLASSPAKSPPSNLSPSSSSWTDEPARKKVASVETPAAVGGVGKSVAVGAAVPRAVPKSELTVKLEENLTKSKARTLREALSEKEKKGEAETKRGKTKREKGEEEKTSTSGQAKRRKKRVLMTDLKPSDLTCKECGKEFKVLYKLKLHSLIHSKSFPFMCSVCKKGFNNKYKMRHHEKGHKTSVASTSASSLPATAIKSKIESVAESPQPEGTEAVPNDENDNPEKAASVQKEGIKQSSSSSSKSRCEKCHAEFETESRLKAHLTRDHPNFRRFVCSTCGKGFRGQKGLTNHIENACAKSKPLPCPHCPSQLSCQRDLRRHLADAHGQKQQWKCPQPNCPTVCSSRKSLKIHGKVAHLEGGAEALPFSCPQCGKMFLKQFYLEDHQNRFHASVKQFACMFCPKRCSTKQDLGRHLASHRGEARFQCTYCPRAFVHRANFKAHQRGHVGEKPYRCIPCAKSFGLLCVLQKHQKSHQRKGDKTRIVTAPKGRRGCMSYIDFDETTPSSVSASLVAQDYPQGDPKQQQQQQETTPLAVVGNRPEAYIPSAQYMHPSASHTITPLNQMQVIAAAGDYGEMTTYSLSVDNGGTGGATATTARSALLASNTGMGGTYATYVPTALDNQQHHQQLQQRQHHHQDHQSQQHGQHQQPVLHHGHAEPQHVQHYHTDQTQQQQQQQHVNQEQQQQQQHYVQTAEHSYHMTITSEQQQQQQQQRPSEDHSGATSDPATYQQTDGALALAQPQPQSTHTETLTETESIAMDIMAGLFSEPAAQQGTQTPVDNL